MGKVDVPSLFEKGRGKHAFIIYENIVKYVTTGAQHGNILDMYCLDRSVRMIDFHKANENNLLNDQLKRFSLHLCNSSGLKDCCVNHDSLLLHTTKASDMAMTPLAGKDWAIFRFSHSTHK